MKVGKFYFKELFDVIFKTNDVCGVFLKRIDTKVFKNRKVLFKKDKFNLYLLNYLFEKIFTQPNTLKSEHKLKM